MIGLEMENCNMILTKKLQKYQHYHHVKLINMKILQVKKSDQSDQNQIIEKDKFTHSPFRKNLRKTNKRNWKNSQKTNARHRSKINH